MRRLVDALHPQAIYLFGSHAYGTPDRNSDVDLLVVVEDDAGDRMELEIQGLRALRQMPVPKDVLVFPRSEMDKWSPVRSTLPHTATQKGKLLYAA